MTVGLAKTNKIFYSAAKGIGNPVVYVGSKTGRDGIHGATMASAEFDDATDEKRPTVQVGDPFTEKLLLEACLELMTEDAIIAIQDMGAAGLTSSSIEMADKGGVGIEFDLDLVPQREDNMTAYEMMLSESQERMLMVLKPGREGEAKAIFDKWGLDFAVIGTTTDTGRLILSHHSEVVCDIPIAPLADDAPKYERPWVPTEPNAIVDAASVKAPESLSGALECLMGTPDLASRRWIWEQYDYTVMADTVQIPGGDAGVVRVHGTNKGLAISTDVTPRYCAADPREGGKQAVAETWRNLTATGANPLAITDCLNFGNPERPEIMGQFAGCIEGMAEACSALDYPVVSGNVSLYNETNGEGILPTPAIGGIGLLSNISEMGTFAFKKEGDVVLLLGKTEGHLGQSLYLREIANEESGTPPTVDLMAERKIGDFVRMLINNGTATACHDVSDGGALVAIAEMALAGDLGVELATPSEAEHPHAFWFGEDQARYIVTVDAREAHKVITMILEVGIKVNRLGYVGGTSLSIEEDTPIQIADLRKTNETWFPTYMSET